MADVFSPQRRSEIMSRVRSRGNRATELRLLNIFRQTKISGWRRRSKMFGNPDFVFPSKNLAIFVDGCFWHGCPSHGSLPATNRSFWANKISRNKMRDVTVRRELRKRGWRVLRIWQHELKYPTKVASRVRRYLAQC